MSLQTALIIYIYISIVSTSSNHFLIQNYVRLFLNIISIHHLVLITWTFMHICIYY